MREKKKRIKERKAVWRLKRLVEGIFPGSYPSLKHWGSGISFVKRGQFVAGRDPLKSLDKKTIFKARPLAIFRERMRNTSNMFLVDISPSMLFSSAANFNKADIAEFLLGIAISSARAGNEVGLIAFDDKVRIKSDPRFGSSGLMSAVEKIIFHNPAEVMYKQKKDTLLGSALTSFEKMGTNRSIVFIISDFNFVCNYEAELKLTAATNGVIPIVIVDDEDDIGPVRGVYYVSRNIETGLSEKVSELRRNREYIDCFNRLRLNHLTLNTKMNANEIKTKLIRYFSQRRI